MNRQPNFLRSVKFAIVALLILFCSIPVSIASPQAEPPFSIEILPSQSASYPGRPTWKVGSPVFVIIRMTNNSPKVLRFFLTNPALNYHWKVLDRDGNQVPATELLKLLKTDWVLKTRNILVELQPKGTATDGFEPSAYYDISKPGNYTIQVQREMPPELGTGPVESNILHVTITQ